MTESKPMTKEERARVEDFNGLRDEAVRQNNELKRAANALVAAAASLLEVGPPYITAARCAQDAADRARSQHLLVPVRAVEQREARLREALEAIAEDPHCLYTSEQASSTHDLQYRHGVADGHRCAAAKACAALRSATPENPSRK